MSGSCWKTCSPRSGSSAERRPDPPHPRKKKETDMSGTYTRRGFIGLSAAAIAAGLAACTGGGTAPAPAGQGGTSAPASNELRLFTYEGDETIDAFNEQIAKF